MISEKRLNVVSEKLSKAIIIEETRKLELARMKANLESLKVTVLAEAYDAGIISGKNAETRKAQSQAFLTNHPDVIRITDDIMQAEDSLVYVTAERVHWETYVSLLRAFMYQGVRL